MKLTNIFDCIGLMQTHYGPGLDTPDYADFIREIANRGWDGIRFVSTGFWGPQDIRRPYCDPWVMPWRRNGAGLVDFDHPNPIWADRFVMILELMKRYNLIPRIDIFDGCGHSMGYNPYGTGNNLQGIPCLWDARMWPYIESYVINVFINSRRVYDPTDIAWGSGNEMYALGMDFRASAVFMKKIADLFTRLGAGWRCAASATELMHDPITQDLVPAYTLGVTPHAEWVQAEFMRDYEPGKGFGDRERVNNTIIEMHGHDSERDFESLQYPDGKFGRITKHGGAVPHCGALSMVAISTDGAQFNPPDKRHQSGHPHAPGYGMGTDEQIRDLYVQAVTTCINNHVKELWYGYLENGWIRTVQNKAGGIEYVVDRRGYDWRASDLIMAAYKKLMGQPPVNLGKFPKEPPTPPPPKPEPPGPQPTPGPVIPTPEEDDLKYINLFGPRITDIRFSDWIRQWPACAGQSLRFGRDNLYLLLILATIIAVLVLIFK